MLEEILRDYFGFSGRIGGPEWASAYNRLTNLIHDLGRLGVIDGNSVIEQLDDIDSLDEELVDNCESGSYDCSTCVNDGDCPRQGIDGRPFWEEECDLCCKICLYSNLCYKREELEKIIHETEG